MKRASLLLVLASGAAAACGSSQTSSPAAAPLPEPTLKSQVQPVTRVADAQPGVAIPPFMDCRSPAAGETGSAPDGKVCTHVSIAGCTEPGKYFPDYADCDVVRTQRPYYAAPPAASTRPDDPRLQDAKFMSELAWVTEQVRASACTCCHDTKQGPKGASKWAIDLGPIWTDSVSDRGIALFSGFANSAVLGAYPAADNHGFERDKTGLPSTDGDRMRAFFTAELARRGMTPEQAAAVPPFGGPIYENIVTPPDACKNGEGVDARGVMHWRSPARYIYVLDAGAKNPGVPPNLDLPEGTRWRLDVLPSADAIATGLTYGTTPPGSFQAYPETGRAPALVEGASYVIFTEIDVGFASTKCVFTYPVPAE